MEYILKCIVSSVVSGSAVYLYYLYLGEKEAAGRSACPESRALFFYESINCKRMCIQKHFFCGDNCAYIKQKILNNLIFSTQKTLDICVFLCTNAQFAKSIIDISKRGVKIRMIVDENMSHCRESKVSKFIEAGLLKVVKLFFI